MDIEKEITELKYELEKLKQEQAFNRKMQNQTLQMVSNTIESARKEGYEGNIPMPAFMQMTGW